VDYLDYRKFKPEEDKVLEMGSQMLPLTDFGNESIQFFQADIFGTSFHGTGTISVDETYGIQCQVNISVINSTFPFWQYEYPFPEGLDFQQLLDSIEFSNDHEFSYSPAMYEATL